jgi:hypothetical protein
MPSLTIKGISPDLLEGMRRTAQRHRRSLNSEAIVAFERNVASAAPEPDEVLARLGALHREIGNVTSLTPEEIEDAVERGRP